MDESPTSAVPAPPASPAAPAPAAPAPEDEDPVKAEKKRKANEKRKATLAAKKAKKAEDALAAQMGNMTLQPELKQEQMVVTPPAPKAASPKAASPKDESSNDGSALATDFVHEGKCYYNQEGWLYDKTTRACVGFWNGSEIEPVDDESDDEE